MKCFPIELARYFEYCGVGPEEEWRLALYCVSVGSPAVNYFVRHHRIHCLAVNWLGMQKRRKANCNGEEDYPKRGEAKLARPMSSHMHASAKWFPVVVFFRESEMRESSLHTSSTVMARVQGVS